MHDSFLDKAPGYFGQALSLSGENDSHASIPGTESLSRFATAVTVSAWVFAETAPDNFIVVVSRQIDTIKHPDQFFKKIMCIDEILFYGHLR